MLLHLATRHYLINMACFGPEQIAADHRWQWSFGPCVGGFDEAIDINMHLLSRGAVCCI
jgi:hypothetical protein